MAKIPRNLKKIEIKYFTFFSTISTEKTYWFNYFGLEEMRPQNKEIMALFGLIICFLNNQNLELIPQKMNF